MKKIVAISAVVVLITLFVFNMVLLFQTPIIGFAYNLDNNRENAIQKLVFDGNGTVTGTRNEIVRTGEYTVVGNSVEAFGNEMIKVGYTLQMRDTWYGNTVFTYTCTNAVLLQALIGVGYFICVIAIGAVVYLYFVNKPGSA